MFRGRESSWNLRDRHMAETLAALERAHRARRRDRPKIVVWAHNSHLGDARATEMGSGAASSTSASWCASAMASDRVLVGFTHPRRAR